MKVLFFLLLTQVIVLEATAQSDSYVGCLTFEKKWGEQCGSNDSYQVLITNRCEVALDIKVAIRQKNGKYSTGLETNLKPGKTASGFWTCHSDGYYRYWVRKSGSNERFPDDEEINNLHFTLSSFYISLLQLDRIAITFLSNIHYNNSFSFGRR